MFKRLLRLFPRSLSRVYICVLFVQSRYKARSQSRLATFYASNLGVSRLQLRKDGVIKWLLTACIFLLMFEPFMDSTSYENESCVVIVLRMILNPLFWFQFLPLIDQLAQEVLRVGIGMELW